MCAERSLFSLLSFCRGQCKFFVLFSGNDDDIRSPRMKMKKSDIIKKKLEFSVCSLCAFTTNRFWYKLSVWGSQCGSSVWHSVWATNCKHLFWRDGCDRVARTHTRSVRFWVGRNDTRTQPMCRIRCAMCKWIQFGHKYSTAPAVSSARLSYGRFPHSTRMEKMKWKDGPQKRSLTKRTNKTQNNWRMTHSPILCFSPLLKIGHAINIWAHTLACLTYSDIGQSADDQELTQTDVLLIKIYWIYCELIECLILHCSPHKTHVDALHQIKISLKLQSCAEKPFDHEKKCFNGVGNYASVYIQADETHQHMASIYGEGDGKKHKVGKAYRQSSLHVWFAAFHLASPFHHSKPSKGIRHFNHCPFRFANAFVIQKVHHSADGCRRDVSACQVKAIALCIRLGFGKRWKRIAKPNVERKKSRKMLFSFRFFGRHMKVAAQRRSLSSSSSFRLPRRAVIRSTKEKRISWLNMHQVYFWVEALSHSSRCEYRENFILYSFLLSSLL